MKKRAKGPSVFGSPPQKISREVLRVVYQIDDALQRAFGRSVSYYYAKHYVDRLVRVQTGSLDLGRRIAIYLIFPSDGLQESHRVALKFIISSGYTPVVVSNLPLTAADTAELSSLCARLILRPNFGYDFGGYRDAMHILAANLGEIDRLALFNDSSWFPVRPELNWLQKAEAMGFDFVGSVSHDGMVARELLDFAKTNWEIDERAKHFYYGSYSLLFGQNILRSKIFPKFWQDYVPTASKSLTVRHGEMGLTRWVIDSGFTHGAICDNRHLDRLLAELSTGRLRQIAGNLVTYDIPELIAKNALAIAQSPPDPVALRNIILSGVARHGPAYALIEYDTRERLGNFIKKAPLYWNRNAAEATLRVLSQFDNPEAAAFLKEALVTYEAVYGCPWAPTPNPEADLVNTSA